MGQLSRYKCWLSHSWSIKPVTIHILSQATWTPSFHNLQVNCDQSSTTMPNSSSQYCLFALSSLLISCQSRWICCKIWFVFLMLLSLNKRCWINQLKNKCRWELGHGQFHQPHSIERAALSSLRRFNHSAPGFGSTFFLPRNILSFQSSIPRRSHNHWIVSIELASLIKSACSPAISP